MHPSASPTVMLAMAVLAIAVAAAFVAAVVSFLASPMVKFFGPNEVNTWVAYFPFVWLPTVLVLAALVGQIAVVRKLLRRSET